jgi:hypothetical protein
MPAQRDAEQKKTSKPARKTIHLNRLFDRKTEAPQAQPGEPEPERPTRVLDRFGRRWGQRP